MDLGKIHYVPKFVERRWDVVSSKVIMRRVVEKLDGRCRKASSPRHEVFAVVLQECFAQWKRGEKKTNRWHNLFQTRWFWIFHVFFDLWSRNLSSGQEILDSKIGTSSSKFLIESSKVSGMTLRTNECFNIPFWKHKCGGWGDLVLNSVAPSIPWAHLSDAPTTDSFFCDLKMPWDCTSVIKKSSIFYFSRRFGFKIDLEVQDWSW